MAGALVRTALRTSLSQIRHVRPVRPRHAGGLVARVYRQVERDFGMLAPPVALHSPAPAALAASWAMLRETLVVPGDAGRPAKEAVAAAVSDANACPYCVEVHDATLRGLVRDPGADPALAELATWARESGTSDGAARHAWPFPAGHAPELIGVAVTFHYLNRMVHVFLSDSPLPPTVPAGARDRARRFLGWVMRGPAVRSSRPGAAIELLDDAPLPTDLAWAAGNPSIGGAFARAAAAIEGGTVPPSVRELVTAELSDWDGQPGGPSRAWVHDATAALPPADRAAGRLALLAAKASYQIDDAVVAEFRAGAPADAALVELVSWASLTAARRVGGWL
ncbi:MAG TPA: carboxymuconolactone decarboxylase family protein, partial [Actinophytocola sp.]|uniref:carboxymuconolactone decarboxylase family protein n=1 Tax=Actinophytocola sp. TaxID=1872138 RepID=UPI002DDD94EF